jgi:hypothetical protein
MLLTVVLPDQDGGGAAAGAGYPGGSGPRAAPQAGGQDPLHQRPHATRQGRRQLPPGSQARHRTPTRLLTVLRIREILAWIRILTTGSGINSGSDSFLQ